MSTRVRVEYLKKVVEEKVYTNDYIHDIPEKIRRDVDEHNKQYDEEHPHIILNSIEIIEDMEPQTS